MPKKNKVDLQSVNLVALGPWQKQGWEEGLSEREPPLSSPASRPLSTPRVQLQQSTLPAWGSSGLPGAAGHRAAPCPGLQLPGWAIRAQLRAEWWALFVPRKQCPGPDCEVCPQLARLVAAVRPGVLLLLRGSRGLASSSEGPAHTVPTAETCWSRSPVPFPL